MGFFSGRNGGGGWLFSRMKGFYSGGRGEREGDDLVLLIDGLRVRVGKKMLKELAGQSFLQRRDGWVLLEGRNQ